jgi:hypothetical protein
MNLDDVTRNIRRLALAIGLIMVGVAVFDKFVELLGGQLLDRFYAFGATRLLDFADTFILIAVALYLWEIRELLRTRNLMARQSRSSGPRNSPPSS